VGSLEMGAKLTVAEQIKANKRMIQRAVRDMDRERAELERDQRKLEADIRNLAAKGQMSAARIAAKDLVRTRKSVEKFHQMSSTLKGLNLKITTMKTSNEITTAMGKMAKAMKQMNKQMNVPAMQKMMQEFEKQEGAMEMMQDMADDMIDGALGGGEENEDEIVQKVLDEIGVDMNQKLKAAPSKPLHSEEAEAQGVSDLEARLQNLRKE
jgi:charged multivesicular body protein 2A